MLKRLDWLDVHGAHGGDTSSDDSDSDTGKADGCDCCRM